MGNGILILILVASIIINILVMVYFRGDVFVLVANGIILGFNVRSLIEAAINN